MFIANYNRLLDSAESHATDENQKQEIANERNETLKMLAIELPPIIAKNVAAFEENLHSGSTVWMWLGIFAAVSSGSLGIWLLMGIMNGDFDAIIILIPAAVFLIGLVVAIKSRKTIKELKATAQRDRPKS